MITSLASAIYKRRWLVLFSWLVLVAASAFFAPRLLEITSGGGIDLPDSESWRAADILQSEFNRGYRQVVEILYYHPNWQVDDPRYRNEVLGSLNKVKTLPKVSHETTYYNTGLPGLVSPDGTATYAIINFSGKEEDIQPLIPDIRRLASEDTDLEVHVIGGPAFDFDLEKTSEKDLMRAEQYSLPVILVTLVFVFGSLVAAGLPLVLGGASVVVALAALFFIGHEVKLSVFVRNIVTMVGLGLGVDYSLFIVNRFREELVKNGSPLQAVQSTLKTAGRAVIFSGAAVVIGLAMLILFTIVFMRSLGIGGVLVAAISVLVAVSLLPALLSLLREKVNSARVVPARYLQSGGGRFWHKWSCLVMKQPLPFLLASVALLVALAWPVRQMIATSPGVDDLSPQSDSRVGVELFTQKWGLGELSPIYVVIKTDSNCGVFAPGFREGLAQLSQKLKNDPRVARVDSIAELDLPTEVPCDLLKIKTLLEDKPVTAANLASLVSPSGMGKATMVRIVPAIEPRARETKNLVRELRTDILPGIGGLQGAIMLVGGGPAEAVDFSDSMSHSFPYLVAAVLIITYMVLLLLFRSLILPLKAIFMNLLSVSAAYGVLVLVFQEGWGESILNFKAAGGIIPFVPVILFSVLFGLSMDYEVFLLSRIKEEYELTDDNEKAVARGLEKTGRIITTAALIMIAVFGSFALTESIVIKEIGLGLAVSIFLDATIVRVVMVPATMKLLGKWNWWMPKWLARILPDFGLKH